jgi:hypothetical protein
MAAPSMPGRDRKAIRRRPGKQMVEGKSFRLADEVRYIQRQAADRHGRVVTVGQLVLFSTETGDAWLLDPSDQLAVRLARDGDPEPVHIEENDTSFVINWKGDYRIDGPAFIYSDRQNPARLDHLRIPHAPARATILKFQIFLASVWRTCKLRRIWESQYRSRPSPSPDDNGNSEAPPRQAEHVLNDQRNWQSVMPSKLEAISILLARRATAGGPNRVHR